MDGGQDTFSGNACGTKLFAMTATFYLENHQRRDAPAEPPTCGKLPF